MPADGGSRRAVEIVEIAYRQIAQRGFEGLRVRAVAEGAGINQATLLYYFRNKGELIRAVVWRIAQGFQRPCVQQPGGAAVSALEELALEIEDARVRFREEPELIVVLTELDVHSRRDEAVARVLGELYGRWRYHLSGIIERGKESGLFRAETDSAAAATLIIAQFKGIFGLGMNGAESDESLDRILREFRVELVRWLTGGSGSAKRA